jgi:hypothetical protein
LYGSQYPGGKIFNNTPNQGGVGCKGPFCTPPTGRQGTLGRNVLRGFPLTQLDLSLRRQLKIREHLNLQWRADVFNILNHPNFFNPNGSLTNSLFGVATNMANNNPVATNSVGSLNRLYQLGGARSIQISLKLYGTAPPSGQELNNTTVGHYGTLLSAHGYAVLYPSMPRLPRGVANDNYMEVSKGVLPALDKVIDLGIADPKRLGVIGQSYGGFTVYALITQTKRFQAAAALAGPSDFISEWGQFYGATRYELSPQKEAASQQSLIEGGFGSLGAPPWKDVERYVRNSPIFYADRVETPVLIIQGDMDFVPIQQGAPA